MSIGSEFKFQMFAMIELLTIVQKCQIRFVSTSKFLNDVLTFMINSCYRTESETLPRFSSRKYNLIV